MWFTFTFPSPEQKHFLTLKDNNTKRRITMNRARLTNCALGAVPYCSRWFSRKSEQIGSLEMNKTTQRSWPLWTSRRFLYHRVTSTNFEQEVLQSQQAICLVYHIENSNCNVYLRNTEKLVDELNEATTLVQEKSGSEKQNDKDKEMKERHVWLKLCVINADENRNLASAFSVERAKLPITYFIMQGTIIDKVVGHVKETRLHSILYKFLEHYQKEMNVDLLVARGKESAADAGGKSTPLAAATTADLLSGASTEYIINSLTSSLTGPDMIRLPEESEKLDGIRKTIQEAKRKAHKELVELRREIGLDMRNLSDTELHTNYYRAAQFIAMASVSALETLFLARCYAAIGDIARKNVVWARKALSSDFEAALGKATMRNLIALIDTNLVKGDLRVTSIGAQKLLSNFIVTDESMDSKDQANTSGSSTIIPFLEEYVEYTQRMERQINEHIDTRSLEVAFPVSFAEELFDWVKKSRKLIGTHRGASDGMGSSQGLSWILDLTAAGQMDHRPNDASLTPEEMMTRIAEEQFWQAKTVITSLVQLHIADPKAHAARSRLASLIY